MAESLDSIEQQLAGAGSAPPLHRWHPPLSGDIDIRIDREGHWIHEGSEIRRLALVQLFASILRREDDGDYYLVTPVEKWRIAVDLHPLLVTDVEPVDNRLLLTLNTGRQLLVGEDHPLFSEPREQGACGVELWHGLSALFSRNAWYRLVELADAEGCITSGDYRFSLQAG